MIKKTVLKLFISFVVFSFLTPLCAFASSHILAFNWGSSDGVLAGLDSVKIDSPKSEQGYLIGPQFWSSLRESQNDADHNAGDGLYFSTHPFDSSRFGPSLMIVEIEIDHLENPDLIKSMTGEQAQIHPDRLPTIVKYRGSWHVIKSLPRDEKLKIWIREPTEKDVDFLFESYKLKTNLSAVLDFIVRIDARYNARFRRFEMQDGIPKAFSNNQSTQKFMDKLIEKLVEEGLHTRSINFNDSNEIRLFASSLGHLLSNLKQQKDEKKIFGRNMTKTIYENLLGLSVDWPEAVLKQFRHYNEDYYLKYKNQVQPKQYLKCLRLF